MNLTSNLQQQTTRTLLERNHRRSIGSFYDLLPSVFDAVEKPSKDSILQRLNDNTRSDRKAEWRIRTRYEGGCCNEFGNLVTRGNGCSHSSLNQHPLQRTYARQNLMTDDNSREEGYFIGGNDKSHSVLRSNHLKYSLGDDSRAQIANSIREQCRRKGELYGPDAISAVGGRGMTTPYGGSTPTRSPRPQVGSSYDDYECSVLVNKSSTMIWPQQLSRRSSTSSVASSPRRNRVPDSDGTDQCLEWRQERWNMLLNGDIRNESETKSSIRKSLDSSRESVRAASELGEKVTRTTRCTDKIAKIVVQLEYGDGDQSKKFDASSHGKMNVHKQFQSTTRTKRRRKRRGKALVAGKQKSLSKYLVAEDKRHKGPKIEGFNWPRLSDPSINSNNDNHNRENPIVRTVILPYPKSKYRHNVI